MRETDPNDPNPRLRYRREHGLTTAVSVVTLTAGVWAYSCVPVLDRSGRIDMLDLDTLELAGPAGSLPKVPELFARSSSRSKPRDLSAFGVSPIHDHSFGSSRYVGYTAFARNRDGSATTLAVYDRAGRQVASNTVWTIGTNAPGGMLAMTVRFCFENMHPPVLSLVSFFTASHYTGGAGYRSIFALPDSFIATKGRDQRGYYVFRLMEGLALIAPSIVLAVVLACFLSRRTRRMGLSNDARLFWVIATMAFGIPAYLTYRLTEPRERLVTCPNCGKLRRPDRDRCHHCQSLWDVPELVAPAWRVLDGGQDRAPDTLPEPPESQSSEPESSPSDSSTEEEPK